MRYVLFFLIAMFAVILSLKPEMVSSYSNGWIEAYRIQTIKLFTWGLLTVNWFYILWYNKKKQDQYKEMIDNIGNDLESK